MLPPRDRGRDGNEMGEVRSGTGVRGGNERERKGGEGRREKVMGEEKDEEQGERGKDEA